jgi:hypothetical protein
MQALLRLNGLKDHITSEQATPTAPWTESEELVLGVFEMYTQKDVWNTVSDDIKFKTCKSKWDELKKVYGGVGSMSAFNNWIALTGTSLDESKPMLPQLQKLNDACTTLRNNNMEITPLQFSFILIKALPESYSAVASTILAAGEPKDLSPITIQERILNEEGRRSGTSASLNKVAPIKTKDKNITCFYCNKKGHKSNECKKKKRDLAAKEKKDKEQGNATNTASTSKAVNAHIVPTTATITEISDDDNQIRVSLYSAARSRWMVDSGATHHISPYRSDFISWKPARGRVSLGGHAEIDQIGTGDIVVKPLGGNPNIQLTLHDVMHVPDACTHFFSVSALTRKGGKIAFDKAGFTIYVKDRKIATGYMEGNLFYFDTSNPAIHTHTDAAKSIDIWHQRMGHMSHNALMRYSESVKGITLSAPIDQDRDQSLCPGCELGKQSRLPFSASPKRSDRRLQIIHSDLCGPMQK